MKLKCFDLHINWLILRLECVESKYELKSGGHQVIFRDYELLIIKYCEYIYIYIFNLLLINKPCI